MTALSEYCWLIGMLHMDPEDKIMYITTRIEIDSNGYIVAYRQQVNLKRQPIGRESKNSFHVADIAEYTKSTQLVTTNSSSSSSLSSSQTLSAEAIPDSLKCEVIGCNEDQFDICTFECKKNLCTVYFKLQYSYGSKILSQHDYGKNVIFLLQIILFFYLSS